MVVDMVLSVITPDERLGMKSMLSHELQGIDSEIIFDDWYFGIEQAHGDFICLLEHDSAVSRGALAKQLEPFLTNTHYRKLAMVSPLIEFDDTEPISLSGLQVHTKYSKMTRIGCVPGAIIRRTSLLKYIELLDNDVSDLSYELSVLFWEHGLRIIADPTCIYYSPSRLKRGGAIVASDKVVELWHRECII